MKMAKKFLAVALAGVLALSVLTGCGASVKSKDVADALTKMDIKVEQDKGVDATAKKTLDAIETLINSETNTGAGKITLGNAVGDEGKIIDDTGFKTVAGVDNVKKALGMYAAGSDAEKANADKDKKQVRVALVKTEDATKDASLQAAFVKDGLVTASESMSADKTMVEPGKLGTAKTSDGKYMLVVIVNDVVAKANT
ncbi:MAG: hypothetical protein SPF64_01135 [Faecalibacterium longum]|nr:hypothetical protein [Faecalibacterium prausnitzii]MDY5548947.1 hypothetical protein [Faecalibacterium longum]